MTHDYHDFCTKDTPKEQRRKMNIGDWWVNAVRCLKCNDVIRSKNRHDYVTCSCGSVSVDGGSWYLKRCGDAGGYEDLSVKFSNVEDSQ